MRLAEISDRTLEKNGIERQTARNLARAGRLWWRRPQDPERAGWIYAGPFRILEDGGTLEAIEPPKATDKQLDERRDRALAALATRRFRRTGRLGLVDDVRPSVASFSGALGALRYATTQGAPSVWSQGFSSGDDLACDGPSRRSPGVQHDR